MNSIRQLRLQKGMTQKAIADLLHISVSTVTKWETGKSNPQIAKLPELAQIFCCSIDDLLCNEGYQDSSNGGSG